MNPFYTLFLVLNQIINTPFGRACSFATLVYGCLKWSILKIHLKHPDVVIPFQDDNFMLLLISGLIVYLLYRFFDWICLLGLTEVRPIFFCVFLFAFVKLKNTMCGQIYRENTKCTRSEVFFKVPSFIFLYCLLLCFWRWESWFIVF